MRRRGWSERRIETRVYAPFPIAGLAAWTDTWGAPRFVGGYHPHHGQDLMCATGTPLLAVEPGTVRLASDALGGTTLFLVRPDGSFWYYAHLSGYARGVADGVHVATGNRVGFCGSSGDATVSHLHFSHYAATGAARNPMQDLLRWLHAAEHTSGVPVSDGTGVHIPSDLKAEGGAGDEPANVTPRPAVEHVRSLVPAMVPSATTPTDMISAGDRRNGFGLVLAAALLVLPLPLASRRVRHQARRLARVPRAS